MENDQFSFKGIIPFMFLIIFSSITCNIIFAQEITESDRSINVTQDMIDLLTNITDSSNGEIIDFNPILNDSSDLTTSTEQNKTQSLSNSFLTKESASIFLEDKSLPESSFMYIYQTAPFEITEGYITAKLPCDDNASTEVDILVGEMPDFNNTSPEFISQFSEPGNLCNYRLSISSNTTSSFSEIAIYNNSTEDVEFPASSTIMIGITKLADPNE